MKRMIVLFASSLLLSVFLPSQEMIRNPKKPLSSNAGRILDVEEIFRITDESEEYFFKYLSSIKIADDGSIFLTDESQFLKFTSDGKYLKNILKKGQGPGEIQSPFFYYHLQDENLFAYDPMNTKIVHMDQEGNLIDEFKLKERYQGFLGLWGDDFIFTKYIRPELEDKAGQFFNIPSKIRMVSREGEIINECSGIPEKMFLHPNLAARFPRLASVISEDGKICFISDPDEYMVSVFDLEKFEFIRKFKRDYPRVKQSKKETPSRSSIKIPKRKYMNDIFDLYNFKGNLWVQTSTEDDKKGSLYDVFNRSGQYIDSFWLDVGETLIATHGEYLFVRERDEDHNMSIIKYRVVE